MPKSNHYYLRAEGSKKGQKIAPIRTLTPPPIRICFCQEKMVKDFLDFFHEKCLCLQYLPIKNKKYKERSILL
jgi:hypothetical protein